MEKAEQQVNDWQLLFPVVAATPECLTDAMSLTRQHLVSFLDALLLVTAKKNEVTHIISEDFQEGIILEEVTVINPFNIDNQFEDMKITSFLNKRITHYKNKVISWSQSIDIA